MVKVAICDDEVTTLEQMRVLLEEYPLALQVDAFLCGEELVAAKESYEIIFLDVDMAGMNGIETAHEIRKKDKKVKIIYVTNYSDYTTFAFAVHAFAYLLKPVVNIYFTYIFDTIGRNNQLERELFLYQQQEQMQTAYYKSLEQKYTDTRKLVHDIRNHVEAMEALYLEQQSVRGIEYANDIHGMLNQLGQTFYTSNQMLNIVLNDKVEKMYQAGIEADIKISELPEPFMRDVDITTLFGNLLDNAIEAASECKGEETFVRLWVAAVHSFYTIHLENSSNEPRKKAGQMISGKKGHEGIGLGNISRVVGSYGGDIEYGWKDGVFFTNIMLEGGDV